MLTDKETGRLTLTTFYKLYKHYKSTWDLEMLMWHTKTTYAEVDKRSQQADEWF